MHIYYDTLPEHMRDGARLYIEHGIEPGSFMQAVLENDLVRAFGAADETNTRHMRDWADWIYNVCPRDAWGSHDKVVAWIKRGGIGKSA